MAQMLRLDPIRCDGYGICAVHLPERIALDEWGYPLIEPGPVPERLLSRARRAAGACPVLALGLRPVAPAPATRASRPGIRPGNAGA